MAENGRKGQAQFDDAADHWGGNRGASTFGSRLAEPAYRTCLAYERQHGGYRVERQKALPGVSTEVKPDCGDRLDRAGEDKLMVEVQAIERLTPIHDAQLLSISAFAARA